MKFAYADPPYLGCGKLYLDHHQDALDWDNPERHRQLVVDLCRDYPDGWALSLSSPSLKVILPMCPDDCLVAAWVRSKSPPFYPVRVTKSWEPVIYRGGRPKYRNGEEFVRDFCAAHIVDNGLIGSKPRKFNRWIFSLLGAKCGDIFHDLFPGTFGLSAAWAEWADEASPLAELPLWENGNEFTSVARNATA